MESNEIETDDILELFVHQTEPSNLVRTRSSPWISTSPSQSSIAISQDSHVYSLSTAANPCSSHTYTCTPPRIPQSPAAFTACSTQTCTPQRISQHRAPPAFTAYTTVGTTQGQSGHVTCQPTGRVTCQPTGHVTCEPDHVTSEPYAEDTVDPETRVTGHLSDSSSSTSSSNSVSPVIGEDVDSPGCEGPPCTWPFPVFYLGGQLWRHTASCHGPPAAHVIARDVTTEDSADQISPFTHVLQVSMSLSRYFHLWTDLQKPDREDTVAEDINTSDSTTYVTTSSAPCYDAVGGVHHQPGIPAVQDISPAPNRNKRFKIATKPHGHTSPSASSSRSLTFSTRNSQRFP